jgi:hypothetical protein
MQDLQKELRFGATPLKQLLPSLCVPSALRFIEDHYMLRRRSAIFYSVLLEIRQESL